MLKLIVGTAAIDKAIASIKNRGAKLDGDIQLAGLSILSNIDSCGDTTIADRLYNAMPKGSRRLALAEWMLAYGRMVPITDKAVLKTGRVFQYDHERTTDMEGAAVKPWHEMNAQKDKPVAEVFDVQKAFASLMARIKKAGDDGIKIEGAELAAKLAKLM